MNTQTSELLNQLALKLGTTTQYLWGVLLRQAPIAATIQLIQTLLVLVFAFVLLRLHKKFSKEVNNYSYYENNEGAIFIMVILGIVCAIFLTVSFICIGDIINGYFNPEYWALNKVLDAISSK